MTIVPLHRSRTDEHQNTSGSPARLESLTGLRWFATFGVFLSHVNILLPLPHTRGLFSLGESGVSLFFMLSGFVLAWNWTPKDTAKAFYGRRFARVWPLLFVAVAIPTLFAATAEGGGPVAHLLLISLSAVLLVQAWVPGWILLGASPVTWSLSCEAFFYGVFPATMRRLHGAKVRSLVLLVCAAVVLLWVIRISLWFAYPPTREVSSLDGYGPAVFAIYSPISRIPQFLIGMAVAIAMRRGWRAVSVRTAVLAMLVPFVVLWLLRGYEFRSAVLFDGVDTAVTPFFALFIAALARRDVEGGKSFLRNRPMVRLGQWSYAFYLFQFTVLLPVALSANPGKHVADFFTDPLAPSTGYIGYALLALAITLGISAFFYRFLEHPLETRIRRRLRPASAPGSANAQDKARSEGLSLT
ncbi:acyltransferase [Streptomyces sp. TBY4]|uniref:acyltransferase family protein n=1 Tax=Streptomyces sp. TBY4 TaxID=2962030 RepID=UPI0020B6AB08|nr:acyltransferase [Streptomyces sp. TBY4]MCP3760678.1 acyltransferase [Streptomyces sp. TBY4]